MDFGPGCGALFEFFAGSATLCSSDLQAVDEKCFFVVGHGCFPNVNEEVVMAVKDDVVKVRRTPRISEEQYREKLGLKRLADDGREVSNPVPMEPPVGYLKQPSIFENMRAMVRAELSRKAAEEGFETEDEAENFDIPDDREPVSKHEYTEMEEEYVKDSARLYNNEVAASRKRKAAQAAMGAGSPEPTPERQGRPKGAREALDAPTGSGTASETDDTQ